MSNNLKSIFEGSGLLTPLNPEDVDIDTECPICDKKGQYNGCPRCGRVKDLITGLTFLPNASQDTNKRVTTMTLQNDNLISLKNLDELIIPRHFQNLEWDPDILYNDYQSYVDDERFIRYVDQLTTAYSIFKQGKLLGGSALIASTIKFGKTTWAYCCMREAFKNGYKVLPIIDTSQLRRLAMLYSEKPSWQERVNGYTYKDYMESDILFITIPTNLEHALYAFEVMLQTLEVRARISKPTVFLSNYPISLLTEKDQFKQLTSLLSGGTKVDSYKYLIALTFEDIQEVSLN